MADTVPGGGHDAIARALRDSDDRLRSVINSASMVLWALDAEGRFTFSDGGALRRLGLRPGQVVGRSVFEVYAEIPQIVEDNRRALAGEEFTTLTQVGQATFEARYSVQRGAGGEVAGVIGVAVDVSDRLRSEAEREQSLSLLRATLDATAEGILVADSDGRVVTYNRKFLELWGLPADAVMPGCEACAIAGFAEQLSDADRFRALHHELAAAPEARIQQFLEFRDGRTFEVFTQPQRIGERVVGRVWSFRDVTDRRRAEALLRQRAEQAARFQDALVGLARSRSDDLDASLQHIVEVDARTLDVSRVSIWLFNENGSELVCRTRHANDGLAVSAIEPLRSDALPDYFAALRERRVIAANDALADAATHELTDSYLRPHGIASMLDVPIWRDGAMVGVVCHEHVGAAREWTVEEQDFAASIADMVSLVLQAFARRRAEAARRASEASYRTIFELANDAICVHDLDTGEILDANRAACALYGYSREQLRELGAARLAAEPAGGGQLVASHFRLAAAGQPQRAEWQARHSSGRTFWQEVELQRVTIDGSDRLLSTARDITARKEAEAVLRRSHDELERLVGERTRDLAQTNALLEAQIAERERAEAELREKSDELEAVFRALPDLYFRLDADDRFLDYKAGHHAGLFVPPESFLGRHIEEVLPSPAAQLIAAGLREVRRTHGLVVVEYALPGPDGELEFEARLLPFAAGQIVTVVRDITEQKETERALKRSEEHFRRITENSSDVASILDGRGVSTYHSPSIERVLGYRVEEIVGTSAFERIHPEDRERCRQVLGRIYGNPGTTHTVEFRYFHKDGSWRTLEVLGRTLLPDSAAEGVIINGRDVTERKAAEEALKRAKLQAENADRAKSEFLSRMSHELRTPLNSILGFAQLLARKPLEPDQQRGVEHILKGGRHLLNLINEVLDIARIEANRQQLSLEPVRAEAVLHEALSLIRPLAVQRGCHVSDRIDLPDIYVRADRQRLTQVLLNLLSNAVKYNRAGGSASIVGERADGQRVRIGVRDTGPGIAAADIERIFEPFERLGAERTGEEGTGLGLALARRLVEAMGGKLTVESTPGVGSTFWIELAEEVSPVQRLANEARRAPAASPAPTALPGATILYIEDNLANLTLVETILAQEPAVRLMPALQGQLGVELACEHRPDLILLDLHLPDMPGSEVLRRLRANEATRGIPVVVISADAMQGSVQRLVDNGAAAYLTKPLDVDEFVQTVRRFLEERRPARSAAAASPQGT